MVFSSGQFSFTSHQELYGSSIISLSVAVLSLPLCECRDSRRSVTGSPAFVSTAVTDSDMMILTSSKMKEFCVKIPYTVVT
jgi:hypothetical protein